MDISALYSLVSKILVLFVIVAIVLLAIMLLSKNKNDIKQSSNELRDEIRTCRTRRYELMGQVLAMFPGDNPYAEKLKKLREIYKMVDNEDKEIQWEEKYIPIMQGFMNTAKKNVPANMQGSWTMANNAVTDNEIKLSQAREAYAAAQNTMIGYQTGPRSVLSKMGDNLANGIRAYETVKKENEEKENGK